MILVTGAAGKTGIAIIKALASRGFESRAMIHRPEHEEKVRLAGATEIKMGDLESDSDLADAFEGIEKVYFIVPNVHPKEIGIGKAAIAAAKEAGIRHFVYHSVHYPQIEAMPHHWRKLRVEEVLIQSGLAFTILQPANYMQNILAYWESIAAQGLFRLPFSIEAHSSPVDLADVAEVASLVLSSDEHLGASYALAGPQILSSIEIAEQISNHLGREVQVERLPLKDWQASARANGLDEDRLQALSKMFSYYDDHDFYGNATTLRSLLGREPSTFAEFLISEIS